MHFHQSNKTTCIKCKDTNHSSELFTKNKLPLPTDEDLTKLVGRTVVLDISKQVCVLFFVLLFYHILKNLILMFDTYSSLDLVKSHFTLFKILSIK